jgi:hypothetical protein
MSERLLSDSFCEATQAALAAADRALDGRRLADLLMGQSEGGAT